MKLHEEFKLYETLWDKHSCLIEDYTLAALGYKVGDLVEYEYGYPAPEILHGMVLDLFENQTTTKLVGVWQLGSYGKADIPVNDILKKISEKDLTEEEKANYDQYGKKFRDKRLKELNATTETDATTDAEKAEVDGQPSTTEPKNAKLNRARQANLKIIKAFKEVGLTTDDLIVTAKNKNGKDYKKASDKLNKLRKTLFGESLEEELEDELDVLHEGGSGGQRTYKDFLLFLAEFLGCEIPANYAANWVLHHCDCDHFNNSEFENLALMNPVHHISFHKQLPENASKDDMKNLLKDGYMKHGPKDKFEYWLIGEDIAARIDKVQTERDMT